MNVNDSIYDVMELVVKHLENFQTSEQKEDLVHGLIKYLIDLERYLE